MAVVRGRCSRVLEVLVDFGWVGGDDGGDRRRWWVVVAVVGDGRW